MKMTKELKELILKGFDDLLDQIWVCENWICEFEAKGDSKNADEWRNCRIKYQKKALKGIEDLIEVEGE